MLKKITILIFIILFISNCFSSEKGKNNLLDFFDRLNGVWNPNDFDYKTVETEYSWGKGKETPNVSIVFENDIIYSAGYVSGIILVKEKIKDKVYLIKFIGDNSEYETEFHFLENNELKFVDNNEMKGAALFFTKNIYRKISGPKSINKKYFTSKVEKLSLRELSSIDSKRIRLLNSGEILRFLEKGDQVTINDAKGTWVKVITEKGEVGWCFDAYLEEVKKN